jgi:dihydroorotase-like cyclic amidohydrolase
MGTLLKRLRRLEEGISTVRKTKIPTTFHNLETLEEISLIRQAKREHLPIFAELSPHALTSDHKDAFLKALEEGIIDCISS